MRTYSYDLGDPRAKKNVDEPGSNLDMEWREAWLSKTVLSRGNGTLNRLQLKTKLAKLDGKASYRCNPKLLLARALREGPQTRCFPRLGTQGCDSTVDQNNPCQRSLSLPLLTYMPKCENKSEFLPGDSGRIFPKKLAEGVQRMYVYMTLHR